MPHLWSTIERVVRTFGWTLCLLIGIAGGNVFAAPDFPALSGRVVDGAGLLSADQIAALTTQLETHETETSNQIVVATVKDLQGYSIADYANRLGRHWGIGQKDKDNGVVLLIAPNEREVRIEVGYGLEGALTDATSSDIIRRQILPNFREDDYPAGIQKGIDNILGAIKGEYTVEPKPKDDDLHAHGPVPIFALVMLMQVFMVFGDRKIKHSVFPAGFAGMLILVLTKNAIAGMAAALVIFALLYFVIKPGGKGGGGTGGGSGAGRVGPHDRQHRGHGRIGGGGFSGGGGSFGGGGASGSW